MLWVTKKKLRIARAATAWLIRRFIDPQAELRFVDEGLEGRAPLRVDRGVARALRVKPDRAVARLERCDLGLVDERCADDATLVAMGRIVHDADRGVDRPETAEAAGLRMITVSFPEVCDDDDEIVARSALLYDALYHTLSKRTRAHKPG